MKFDFGNGTDKGCVRAQNEDSFTLHKPQTARQIIGNGHLAVVCDGMGGARAGKLASTMAAELIPEIYYTEGIGDPRNALVAAIQEANQQIWKRAGENAEYFGMGTTVVAVAIIGEEAYVAHVGDSRCYLCNNDGHIRLLTEDHTMVQRMVNQGVLTSGEAENHDERHMLSRAVGVDDHVEVDITMRPIPLKKGDSLVLCSDGLTNIVSEDEIQQIVSINGAQKAVDKLIQVAKERGAPDNVTVQVIKCHENTFSEEEVNVTTIRSAPLGRAKALAVAWISGLIILLSAFLLWIFNIL